MGRFSTTGSQRGFSLVETIVATGVMVVGVVGLAGLFVTGTVANQSSRKGSYATLLATQKMEQLRALTFSFDAQGLPVTDGDTNLALDPPVPGGGCPPACGLVPGGSLTANTDGYVDYLDGNGVSLGGGPIRPAAAVFTRRWMVQPHPNNPTNTVVLQVLVTTSRNRGSVDDHPELDADNNPTGVTIPGTVTRLPNEARFVTVKTRKFQ